MNINFVAWDNINYDIASNKIKSTGYHNQQHSHPAHSLAACYKRFLTRSTVHGNMTDQGRPIFELPTSLKKTRKDLKLAPKKND